jgi:hypothetical protein
VSPLPPNRAYPAGPQRPRRSATWLARVAAALAALALVLGFAAPSYAADQPDSLTITGTGLSSPITVKSSADPNMFTTLLRQVSWMGSDPGNISSIDPKTLGAKYTITVYTKGSPVQICDVYPLAPGGPRGHRPKAQPKKTVTEAWFYATVNLPEALRAAGVPLTQPSVSGAAGGAAYQDPSLGLKTAEPFSLSREFRQARWAFLGTVGTAVGILALLFLAALRSKKAQR